MTKSVDHIAEQLFKVLTGTGVGGSSNKLVLFTDDGKKTTNPTEARRFYLKNIQMMVNYVVDETTNEIVVNLSKDTDIKGVKSLLSSIRNLANRHIIEYTVKTFGKSIEPRDFAYMAKNKVQESSQLNARQLTVLTDIVNKYIMAPGSETRRAFYALKKQGLIEPFVKDGKVRKGYIATDAGKDLVTTHSKVQEGVAGTVSKSKIGWFATNLNGKLKSFRNEEQARSFASTGKSRETRDKEAMVKNESAYTNAPAEMKVSYDYSDDFYMLRLYVNGELVGEDDGYPGMNGTLTAPIEELAAKHGVDIEELVLVATDDNLQPEGEIGKLVNGKISWNVKEESTYDAAMNEVERINELTPKQKAMKQGAITSPNAGISAKFGLMGEPMTSQKLKKQGPKNPDHDRAEKLIKNGPRGTATAYDKGVKQRYAQKWGKNTNTPLSQVKRDRFDLEDRMDQKHGYKSRKMRGPINKLPEGVNEGFSGWTGSARKSVNQLESARIIVKHKRTVDEEKRGARTRQIESIFIENAEGERFKFPSTNITAAKAMARHVQEGGAPFDDFGQHIYGIMEELNQLKTFSRKNKRNDFFEDAQIGEEITAHIGNLRGSLKSMSTPRGYKAQMEGFTKENEDVSQERIDELKDATTMSYFDESIADSLPYVARVIETLRARQANESRIVEFARQVMNNKGGFALAEACDDDDPEGPAARNYKDKISEVAAWAAYLAPKVQNEALSNSLAQLEENLSAVGSKHVNMAMSAINVVKQQGTVAEAKDTGEEKIDVEESELSKIAESLAKYDVRKLFGV